MDYVDGRCSSTQSSKQGDETWQVKVGSPCHENTYSMMAASAFHDFVTNDRNVYHVY